MNKQVKSVATEKRCALHKINFPSEREIRATSEFYGDAKSSYCKRCMKEHHRQRRIRLQAEANREKRVWSDFHDALQAQAEAILERKGSSEEIIAVAQQAMSVLIGEWIKLNPEEEEQDLEETEEAEQE